MLENPDAGPTAAIKKAIQDGNYAANGVSYGKFKIKVVPASNFTAIWWTESITFPRQPPWKPCRFL